MASKMMILVAIVAFACAVVNGRTFKSTDDPDAQTTFFHHHFPPFGGFGDGFWLGFGDGGRWFGGKRKGGNLGGKRKGGNLIERFSSGGNGGGAGSGTRTGAVGRSKNGGGRSDGGRGDGSRGDSMPIGGGGDNRQP